MARVGKARVAIAGAGITGAYLFRLLIAQGLKADLYDLKPHTRCGLSPCAWGTSKGFAELVEYAGLNPETYILGRFDHLFMDEVKVKAHLLTFNKPKLVEDLLGGAKIIRSPLLPDDYDRVVDATGVARSYLPAIKNDIVLRCVQFRVKRENPCENRIRLGHIGYAWHFPLSAGECHVGCGSLLLDPRTIMEKIGWLGKGDGSGKTVCGCDGKIRLTGPHNSHPFIAGKIWGVGEAIGCVAPLAGDGIVPGMKSAQILVRHWDDPVAYAEAVLEEFHWMQKERSVIDKLMNMEHLGIADALVLRRNSRRMGMEIKIREAAKLMKSLRPH